MNKLFPTIASFAIIISFVALIYFLPKEPVNNKQETINNEQIVADFAEEQVVNEQEKIDDKQETIVNEQLVVNTTEDSKIEQREVPTVANIGRITIPSIGVDAQIELVGVTPTGNMDSPRGPDNAGWYKYGTKLGEVGSAVIAGHSGWRDDIPAIFDNLGNVKIGDKIYTKDTIGTTLTFVVRQIKEFNYNVDPYEIFNSSDGLAHLNLITCAGTWNDISRSSSLRLVVFADREYN